MVLRTSLTGSYPPIDDSGALLQEQNSETKVYDSTRRAVFDQIQAGIDILVDGQVRNDFDLIFASALPGFSLGATSYEIIGPVIPRETSITVKDYLLAQSFAVDREFKTHLAGPMTLAQHAIIAPESPYNSRNDPRLVMDIARALVTEARFLVQAGAEVIQIDEPVLSSNIDLDLTIEAMKLIVDDGEIPYPALHACSNVSSILKYLLKHAPIKMISLDAKILGQYELNDINKAYLQGCGIQLGLGIIDVGSDQIEKKESLQFSLDQYLARFGEENIWAIMPSCGMRHLKHQVAIEKLRVMVEATKAISS